MCRCLKANTFQSDWLIKDAKREEKADPNSKFSYRKAEIQNIFDSAAGWLIAPQGFGCCFCSLNIQPPKAIELNVHLLPVL